MVNVALSVFAAACVFVTAAEVCAQAGDPSEADPIEWSNDRKLRRADFKGSRPPRNDVAARSAITIDASWTCDGDRLDASIRAVFVPDQSWWGGQVRNGWEARRSIVSDVQLLEHEQTHFDLAEIVARKIRSRFAELTDVCTRRGGTTPLAAIVNDYQRELDDEQARYDRETGFGLDPRMQWEWTSKTHRALAGRQNK